MDAQYHRLRGLASELTEFQEVGGTDAVRSEMSGLAMRWEPLKDNVNDRWVWSTKWVHLCTRYSCMYTCTCTYNMYM